MLQAVSLASKKRFKIGEQADPVHFLGWFLNEMQRDLASFGIFLKKKKTVIEECFQGRVSVVSEKDVRTDEQKEQG
jgi:U4/U6.U5 tri-snRNP-associated protein 2